MERGNYVISITHTEKLRARKIGAEDIEEAIRNGVIPDKHMAEICTQVLKATIASLSKERDL